MRLPKPRPLAPVLPVAALADITLLLVFFFLLSTSLAPESGEVACPARRAFTKRLPAPLASSCCAA